MKTLKRIFKYLAWLEAERIKASIHTASSGPLL